MHRAKFVLGGVIGLVWATSAWAVQGEGLTADLENLAWARWQGRMSLGTTLPAWHSAFGTGDTMGLKVDSVSLVGDYYFSRSLAGQRRSGGFRTTGGLIHGPRSQLSGALPLFGTPGAAFTSERHLIAAGDAAGSDGPADIATLPYLGIGYTGLSLKGRWRFNADVGMMALSPGNGVKLGKVANGTQSLDDLLREMRLAPVLQLGVSYSF